MSNPTEGLTDAELGIGNAWMEETLEAILETANKHSGIAEVRGALTGALKALRGAGMAEAGDMSTSDGLGCAPSSNANEGDLMDPSMDDTLVEVSKSVVADVEREPAERARQAEALASHYLAAGIPATANGYATLALSLRTLQRFQGEETMRVREIARDRIGS